MTDKGHAHPEVLEDIVSRDRFAKLFCLRGIDSDAARVLYGDRNNW